MTEFVAIRDAAEGDAEAIARVHVQAWRESYAGLLRPDILAGLSVEKRTGMWRGWFQPVRPRAKLLVAEADGAVVGFGGAGDARPGLLGTDAEITTVYLLERIRRTGVGRRVIGSLFAHLREHGFRSAGLWVFTGNSPARRFYERLGGVAGREQPWEREGQRLTEVAYRFEPIPEL